MKLIKYSYATITDFKKDPGPEKNRTQNNASRPRGNAAQDANSIKNIVREYIFYIV